MGLLGEPVVAALAGAAGLSAAALGRILLTSLAALVWLLVLTALALIWMRMLIHLGLLQEMAEIPIGAPVTCPACGQLTPTTRSARLRHLLRAAPRVLRPRPDDAADNAAAASADARGEAPTDASAPSDDDGGPA